MAVSRRDVLFAVPFLFARARALRGDDNPPTFSADVKVVNVLATVRDKQGKIVRDLTRDDFAISEDGRPQTIRYFARQTDLPLTLGLLVDTSGSMRRLIETERAASYRFFDQVLREDKDMAFVIHFDREIELLRDLTSSRQQLQKALGDLHTPENQWGNRGGGYPGGGQRGRAGGTMLYDAVLLGSDEVMKKQSGRKAHILLTDGDDRGSRTSLSSAIESAQRADTLVYSIRYYDDEAAPMMGRGGYGRYGGRRRPMPASDRSGGKKVLERISRETGGGYFEVSRKHPIEQIYTQIEEELRNQYSIGYTSDKPAAAAGEFRKIQLTVKQKSLVVQTRDGYYTRS